VPGDVGITGTESFFELFDLSGWNAIGAAR
jgi:hypothetical protein